MVLALKSENQILGDQIAKFKAETALNDFNRGSAILTLLECNAQELFQQYMQMLEIIRNYNLDTTTGQDLDNRGFEFGLSRNAARQSTGTVDILRESTFEKVATGLYSGLPSPIAGDTVVRVNDASNPLFGTSGTLIIGRGTSNEEEVTYASAPVDNTNYWEFTVSSFANDHGLDENVILKQGVDEVIATGTLLRVPASGSSPEIQFTTVHDVTLLSGEDKVEDVQVICTTAGEIGNIPIGAIMGEEAFSSPPFAGARAENTSKFTTGRDLETDDDFRNRIKNHIQSLSRGTKLAILNAIIGLVDSETAKRVVSANIVLPTTLDEVVKVFIDDGTGFEPDFRSLGLENIVDESTGGETRLQLDLFPMVKAQVENNIAEPYNMSAGPLAFTYSVGLVSETITFNTSDFDFPASATAEEIVAAINNKANLIEARTSQTGKRVVIQAVADENEDIQVTGGAANAILQFPTDARSTLFLYKDDSLLSKDGSTAFLDSGNQETYNFSGLGAGPWPLNIVVDGKTANPQVVSFQSSDFGNAGAATADEVVDVINEQLAGAVATLINNSTKVRITSNTVKSEGSKLHVTGGSANTVLGFSTSQVTGSEKDYTLNRELGTIELADPLDADQALTAGSQFTRAKARTASPEVYNINIGETLVIEIDGGSPQTVTFPSTGNFSAAQVAAVINAQLQGGTAIVREIGGLDYLEINTNTYDEAIGSILIDSSSTAVDLDFTYDTLFVNQRPHRAFRVSGTSAPWTFVEGENLVVILDNNPASKTFSVPMDFDGDVTTGTSTTQFAALAFNNIFLTNDDLEDFFVVFKSGANTTTGTVTDITNPAGNTFRYIFDSLPANLADFAPGDHVSFSNMQEIENNGNFLVTAVNTTGNGYIEVTNLEGIVESGSTGSALIGQRRQITVYTAVSGAMTVGSALRATPSIGDDFIVIPYTLKNMVTYFNNTKVSTISTKAFIEASEDNTKLQISSKSQGSDGYVQISGGTANVQFQFPTTIVRGLQGYNYYTGLLRLVHRTIYGDDQDLVSFPGVGAAGIQFQILAPTVQELNFDIDVTLTEGVSISSVEDEVKSAITGYVNSLGVGQDVILAEIIDRIMDVDNVTDVEIVSPTINIVIADGEIARTRDSLISIG